MMFPFSSIKPAGSVYFLLELTSHGQSQVRLPQRLKLFAPLGQSLQIIGKCVDLRNPVIQAGDVQPFGFEHFEIIFEVGKTAIMADDADRMSCRLQVGEHLA